MDALYVVIRTLLVYLRIKGGFVCKDHIQNDYIVSDKTIKLIRLLEYVDISKISKLDVSDVVKKK